MQKLGIAVLIAASFAGTVAPSASAAGVGGPCTTQQALFDKYGIGLNMDAPVVGFAYGTACGVTG
jgi:hypothetical protein